MSHNIPTTELQAWVRLSLEPKLKINYARLLLQNIGLPQNIFSSSIATLAKYIPQDLAIQINQDPSPDLAAQIEKTLLWAQNKNHHIITLADTQYPKLVLESHDPPILLYANGNIDLLNQHSFSVVGSRSATVAGIENAYAFSYHLAQSGWNIVSGLATGIDTAAHQASLDAFNKFKTCGSTIAVLGTGIDLVYPASNRNLAHAIAQNGVLISEFPLGKRAMPYHFPKRNRIVASLSQGILIVEAARKSGSLITAKIASEIGREVFAIPGSIHSPQSRGCHQLIKQGAKLVESAQDIADELIQHKLFLDNPKPITTNIDETNKSGQQIDIDLNVNQKTVLDAIAYENIHPNKLIDLTQLDIGTLNATLAQLELKCLIARLPNGFYQRIFSGK